MAGTFCAPSARGCIAWFRWSCRSFCCPWDIFLWRGWLIWAALLFGVRYFRAAPIYDPTPLDPNRRFGALLALLVFLLCFMANPL